MTLRTSAATILTATRIAGDLDARRAAPERRPPLAPGLSRAPTSSVSSTRRDHPRRMTSVRDRGPTIAVSERLAGFLDRRAAVMSTNRESKPRIQLDRRLLTGGAALVTLGGLIGGVGMILAGVAFSSAAKQWVRGLDRPPSETAKVVLGRAKAATAAGTKAWQSEAAVGR
jgi:hypothetical protein